MSELLPPYPFLLDKLNSGKVIPFLGAGASLGGRIPGAKWEKGNKNFLPLGSELAGHLAETTQFPSEEACDLTKVAQYCNVAIGRTALNDELHDIFNCDYPLTSLHRFLAGVDAPLLIITTNYDDLIERALDERNREVGRTARPYDVVIHNTDVKGKGEHLLWWPYGAAEPDERVNPNKLDINLEERTVVYKMHGAVDRKQRERDNYVITEDDYVDFLARMTKNKAVPSIFADPFQTRHFLFLGYGLNDWNLRVVLNRIPKGIRSWAIQYQPRALERRFWQERGVEVYDLKLDEFVHQLTSR
ncbi:MAG TPA: SIR2 family protein [Pyrinomonadaceae bacterium]|nr:SIR2 family protein [Pyrinomonadaceae bacterium]